MNTPVVPPLQFDMTSPTRGEVIRQLDILRGGLRIAMTTIRKLQAKQKIDVDPVLRRLALIRAEAKEVRDAVRQSKTP